MLKDVACVIDTSQVLSWGTSPPAPLDLDLHVMFIATPQERQVASVCTHTRTHAHSHMSADMPRILCYIVMAGMPRILCYIVMAGMPSILCYILWQACHVYFARPECGGSKLARRNDNGGQNGAEVPWACPCLHTCSHACTGRC